MTDEEFDEIINDTSKRIDVDIVWQQDSHPAYLGFRVEVISDKAYPLFIKGSCNPRINALSFVLIHRPVGRIYALDLGKDHANPDGIRVGEKHKHRWDQALRDKQAYVPSDITAPATEPIKVWRQFCLEAKIVHNNSMKELPPLQFNIFT
jgi:hypothetical protein